MIIMSSLASTSDLPNDRFLMILRFWHDGVLLFGVWGDEVVDDMASSSSSTFLIDSGVVEHELVIESEDELHSDSP